MTTTTQAFDELWWLYLCRVHEKHQRFDKALALRSPEIALGRLEQELLAHHPVYYRSIWFLAAVNVLIEAGEPIDLSDRRLIAVIDLTRELSREAGDTRTWRNALANAVIRQSVIGETYRRTRSTDYLTVFSQYLTLIEEFHGDPVSRTFFWWASNLPFSQRRVVTKDGHYIDLPGQSKLESFHAIGMKLFVGSGHYLDLLSQMHTLLKRLLHAAPLTFCNAMWAFGADSLFDTTKVACAIAIHRGRHRLLTGADADANRRRLLQGGPISTVGGSDATDTVRDRDSREIRARILTAEHEWRGKLERERLFDRVHEDVYAEV